MQNQNDHNTKGGRGERKEERGVQEAKNISECHISPRYHFLSTAEGRARLTFAPLRVGRVLDADGELAGVGVEAGHGGGLVHGGRARRRQSELVVPGHRVQRLRQVRRALQDDLLRELLGVAGVPRDQLLQPLETVVDGGLRQGCGGERGKSLSKR